MSLRCRQLRKAKGWTQTELGYRANLEASQISNFERGLGKITLRAIRRIADALEVPVSELFLDERGAAEEIILEYFRVADPSVQEFLLNSARSLGPRKPEEDQAPDDPPA